MPAAILRLALGGLVLGHGGLALEHGTYQQAYLLVCMYQVPVGTCANTIVRTIDRGFDSRAAYI